MLDNLNFDDKSTLNELLSGHHLDEQTLFEYARKITLQHCGNEVYIRGLIEISNICRKDCLYCGLRKSNTNVRRYLMTEAEVLEAAMFAYEHGFGSLVIQSGEQQSTEFTKFIERLCKRIMQKTNTQLTITLSCGEQDESTYRRWYEAGAARYLLRIETSNSQLYAKLHPTDDKHQFTMRRECLFMLRSIGYQVGTGVMIGLPWQTIEDLVDDLLFMKETDIDMCGMGPYIVHPHTPLSVLADNIPPAKDRLKLSLRMIALLRILMKNINIASTTALETLHPDGRLMGLLAGANVFMPNLTPIEYQENYSIYADKPRMHRTQLLNKIHQLEEQLRQHGRLIGWQKSGDPVHYQHRRNTC